MKYQKEIIEFIGVAKYDEWGGGYIWGTQPDTSAEMLGQLNDLPQDDEVVNEVLSVRGWGAIQHLFPNIESAADFQDHLGKFIAEAINEKVQTIKLHNNEQR